MTDQPDAGTDPIARLRADRAAAFAARDPNAGLCVLATATTRGPELRTLVLRELPQFALFINSGSPKAAEVDAASGQVALLVWLPSQQVQYRLRAHAQRLDRAVIDEHWPQRPVTNRWLDWAYQQVPQSSVVDDPATVLTARSVRAAALGDDPRVAPPEAIALGLAFDHVERLHLGPPPALHRRQSWQREAGDRWRHEWRVP